ncbi:MAG: HD domain-containing protein, partial [Desulfobulbaceae bacterium]|nr:HD domain-containing protein [Desulfobulbaceae bacterium]
MSFSLDESQGKNRLETRLSGEGLASLPAKLLRSLTEISCRRQLPVYFSGGVVRDWLLDTPPADLDITVMRDAMAFARDLAGALGAAYVPLSEVEGVARVVWSDGTFSIDVSQFREGTTTIVDDLMRRDFSVNAMAVELDSVRQTLADDGLLIDPLAGIVDLQHGVIRLAYPKALLADPLRMLRAYRFRAVFDWRIEKETRSAIAAHAPLIGQVSGERIAYELDTIFNCEQSHATVQEMVETGLLFHIFPELSPGVGLLQPSSHHLDVFGHSLETLRQIERIILEPQAFFDFGGNVQQGSDWHHDMQEYLGAPRQKIRLKYAALLHDLGKTLTCAEKEGRITFYNHDEAGVALLKGIAARLRWSHEDSCRISQLVKQHMWPFHLHNAKTRTGITPKAVLKLVKAAGDDLLGLFLLVMADSLAGQGPGKPLGMERAVAVLFSEVYQT